MKYEMPTYKEDGQETVDSLVSCAENSEELTRRRVWRE